MAQREKLELELNKPTTMELLFDEPITGENRYGSYALYTVNVGDKEYSFFPSKSVHEEMQKLSKGSKVTVTKLAAERGNKIVTTYDVKPEAGSNTTNNGNGYKSKNNGQSNGNCSSQQSDNLYQIMLYSYKDAIKIQSELNGAADVTRIAITLFIARSKGVSGNGYN